MRRVNEKIYRGHIGGVKRETLRVRLGCGGAAIDTVLTFSIPVICSAGSD
jgi:hypothetical protein